MAKTSKPAKKAAAKPAKRKVNPALMRPVQPDDKLAAVVGSKPLPRGALTKKLWDYIKKNGLQDSKNRRNINADDLLKPIFNGKKTVSMFEMTKLVSGHIKG
jgi:chromatin remodeling complex protein RSC6